MKAGAKPPNSSRLSPAVFENNTGSDVCQSCGACCATSAAWPRFSTEDDAALAQIPEGLVNEATSGMRCSGDRCAALAGDVGLTTTCTIYSIRPQVCRDCQPGDPECIEARQKFELSALATL